MNEVSSMVDIMERIDRLSPLRSCHDISDELAPIVKELFEQDRHADATLIEYELLACLLTARATIFASYQESGVAQLSGSLIGQFGYDDGSVWPDPDDFSQECLTYLRNRAIETPNSVIKARYNHLFFEKSQASGSHIAALAAIDAYLESSQRFAESGLPRHAMEMINCMDQATYLAITLGIQEKIIEVVQSLTLLIEGQAKPPLQNSNSELSSHGRWALEPARILLFVRRSRKFGNLVSDASLVKVKSLIVELAAHLKQEGYGHLEGMFLQVAAEAARLLKETSEVYALELRRGEAIARQGKETEVLPPGNGPNHLTAATYYEDAVEHFQRMRERLQMTPEQRLELLSREDNFKVKIREMYRLGRAEMGRFEVPIEVPEDELDLMLEDLLSVETLYGCLDRIITDGSLLPNLELAEQTANESASQGGLLASLPKRAIQNDMAISSPQTESDRHAYEINRNLLMWIQMNSSIVLANLFGRLEQQKGLNAQSLTDYLTNTNLFDEDNLTLVQTGIERHFAGDYVSALHILVPQFEDVIRTLFQQAGSGMIRKRRGQVGWEVETFGAFLDRETVKRTVPSEMHAYIRVVMTEQTGLNLRNRIAHGLIRPQDCTIVTSVTVLHLFLLLTLFRLSDDPVATVAEATVEANMNMGTTL